MEHNCTPPPPSNHANNCRPPSIFLVPTRVHAFSPGWRSQRMTQMNYVACIRCDWLPRREFESCTRPESISRNDRRRHRVSTPSYPLTLPLNPRFSVSFPLNQISNHLGNSRLEEVSHGTVVWECSMWIEFAQRLGVIPARYSRLHCTLDTLPKMYIPAVTSWATVTLRGIASKMQR